METTIATVKVENEMDVVLAHKYATQMGEISGMSISDHTRMATAVAEVCRNCLEFAGEGQLTYAIVDRSGVNFIKATIVDQGPGIPGQELEYIRAGKRLFKGTRGTGLQNVQKLVDHFEFVSGPEGTTVCLYKHIGIRQSQITPKVVEALREYFAHQQPVSPYEELKKRNTHLLELTEQLRLKNIETEYQLNEIRRLNIEMERKQQELIQSEILVHEGRETFKYLADIIPQTIWKTDNEGVVEYVNPHFEKYTGLGLADLQKFGWKKIVHPDDWALVDKRWKQSLEDAVPVDIEFRMRAIDGSYKWHRTLGELISGNDDSKLTWVGTISDIDDRKRSSDELERMVYTRTEELLRANEELSRSNMELEQFAYVASHDLQEPLRMVNSFTMLLEQRYNKELADEAKEYISFVREGATRMQVLINDLLSYSRVGRKDVHFQQVNLNDVLANVKTNLHDKFTTRKVTLKVGVLPSIYSIRLTMVQLFQNLLDNAIKFNDKAEPQLEIGSRQEGDKWLFWVRDNGIGISEKYLNRIFVIFQRLHTRNQYPGTGMGLAICKKIVELYGGSIWVESVPDQGSTFYFTIPKERQENLRQSPASELLQTT